MNDDLWATTDTTIGTPPFDVNYSGFSEFSITDWIWDFGNGDSAFVMSPSYQYTTPGVYNVTLSGIKFYRRHTDKKISEPYLCLDGFNLVEFRSYKCLSSGD